VHLRLRCGFSTNEGHDTVGPEWAHT
jgi:hypothetical protein